MVDTAKKNQQEQRQQKLLLVKVQQIYNEVWKVYVNFLVI